MQNLKFKTSGFLLSLFVASISYFLSNSATFAQEEDVTPTPTKAAIISESLPSGINLTLSPTFINLKTDPGRVVSSEFTVRNNNVFQERLRLSLVKFVNSESGTPIIADIEEGDEFATWIDFAEEEFTVNPSQNKTIKFSVSPPKSAALGYYYGILISRSSKSEGRGAVIAASTAIPVLLDVASPNARREVQIVDFKTDKLFYEYPPVEFRVRFKNSGNIHVSPAGDVFVDSLFNDNVAIIKANEGRGNVLPEGERTFTAIWNDGFATRVVKTNADGTPFKDDKGATVYETKYDFSKTNLFRFGRYTANLLMVYDNGERDIPVEAKVSFWIIPWKIIGIALLVLLLALLGLRSIFMPVFRRLRGR